MEVLLLLCILLGYKPEEILEKLKYYSTVYSKYTLLDKIKAPFELVFRGGGKDPIIIKETIDELFKDTKYKKMNDIKIPCFIPTLDISQKETVYYTSMPIENEKCYMDRPISEAIKNSSSLPLLFVPNTVYIDGKLHQFLDGGMTHNTPSTHLKDFCDIAIGVENIYNKEIDNKKVNIITGIRDCFQGMRRSAVPFQRQSGDIWVQVDCGKVDFTGTPEDVEYCYKQGYEAGKKIISKLKDIDNNGEK